MEEINKIPLSSGLHNFNLHKINEIDLFNLDTSRSFDYLEKKSNKKNQKKSVPFSSLKKKNPEHPGVNKDLTSFNYISSHDLQEPLRKIQTFSSRILEKEEKNLSDSGKDYFHRMQSAAKRMQTIIEDLLALSKINTGEREFINTDLNSILEVVKADLQETIREKHAVISCCGLCEVPVIPAQMHQLLKNLISNSLKFSKPKNELHINISGEVKKGNKLDARLAPHKKYLHIRVSDTGIGFDPQFSERIFEVFQRLHAREDYEGTGIGLALCKKIVENHRGMIHASGKEQEGACFDLFIPAVQK